VLTPESANVAGESKLEIQPDGVLKSVYKLAANETYAITVKTSLAKVTGFRLEALDDDAFPQRGPGGSPNGNFVLTEFKAAQLKHLPEADGKPAKDVKEPLKLQNPRADFAQDGFPIDAAIDGKKDTGWAILPEVGKPHFALFELAEPLSGEGEKTIVLNLEFGSRFPQHQIAKLRLSATGKSNPSSHWLPPKVKDALVLVADKRNDAQKTEILNYYKSIAPALQPVRAELLSVEKQKEDSLKAIPHTLVSISSSTPRTVRVLPRGNWLSDAGDVVSPAVPKFLSDVNTSDRKPTRLDLANWLISRENPLTARVFVNRLWKLYFGAGLSRKLDDLGAQGEAPSNPDLLDWLAVEFMQGGWDIKHMIKLMVMSGTYRQSSNMPAQLREADPENRYLARQSRLRLDAELVRDNALFISGLLSPKIGGASARPYQPAGYWDYLNFPRRTYEADKGENQYRRGLYTWVQRTFPHPSLIAFDASSREECTAERARSNIPQQALVLLNDPTYVEAARVFAEHIVKDGGKTVPERIDWAYLHALSRKPKVQETAILTELLEKHRKQYAESTQAAQELVSVGEALVAKELDPAELAAWTSVARAILNLHETITRY